MPSVPFRRDSAQILRSDGFEILPSLFAGSPLSEDRMVLGNTGACGRRCGRGVAGNTQRRGVFVCVGGYSQTGSSVRGSVLRQLRDGHSGAANTAGETADASAVPGCASRLCETRDGSKQAKMVFSKKGSGRPQLFSPPNPSSVSLFHMAGHSTGFGMGGAAGVHAG